MSAHEPTPTAAEGSDDEISLLDLFVVLAEHWKLLVFGPLAAGLAALGITFVVAPIFTATARILPPQQQQSAASMVAQQLGALAGLAGAAAGLKNPADQYVALLKSRSVADRLIERFDLLRVYDKEYLQDARKALDNNTKINAGRDGLITIDVDDEDPKRAAAIANAYVEELGELMKRLALTEAQQRRAFFEKQLEQTREGLKRAQQALAAVGVSESVLKAEPRAAAEGVAQLKAAVTAKEVQLSAMRGYLAETSPDFRQAQQELAALRSQLARAEQADTTAAAGSASQDYISRYRDFKYQETLFELMARQYEIARLDEAREGALIQVVDTAVQPERKSRPKRALVAIVTTLAAGLALVVWIFLRRAWRNAAATPEGAARLAAIRGAFARRRA
ncbi:GumC family protein [Azohydromonas sediminis]|uniref:GumC family protein n=1 Tax=Azohydromonas sediminis TaxID=2259674 RepID=UPI000E65B13F|nr:Wzz/FepE/Etk N-terminal domain-containing protein [Azohydromonas sediminis]